MGPYKSQRKRLKIDKNSTFCGIFEIKLFLIIQGNVVVGLFLDISVWGPERKIFLYHLPYIHLEKLMLKLKN